MYPSSCPAHEMTAKHSHYSMAAYLGSVVAQSDETLKDAIVGASTPSSRYQDIVKGEKQSADAVSCHSESYLELKAFSMAMRVGTCEHILRTGSTWG